MEGHDEDKLRQLVIKLNELDDEMHEKQAEMVDLITAYYDDDSEDLNKKLPEDILDGLHDLGMVDEETGELYL